MYEKTIAACLRHQNSQWEIGDALLEECEADVGQLVDALAEQGLEYTPRYLRIMRDVARIYEPDTRAAHISWSVYREYLTHSEVLTKWIANHPGESMTVAKAKEHVSWLIHGDGDPAPEAPEGPAEPVEYLPPSSKLSPAPQEPQEPQELAAAPAQARALLAFAVLQRRAGDAFEESWSVATDLIEYIKNNEADIPEDWKAGVTKLAEDTRDKLSELLRFTRPKSSKRAGTIIHLQQPARM
jgi:hypothetical protein